MVMVMMMVVVELTVEVGWGKDIYEAICLIC